MTSAVAVLTIVAVPVVNPPVTNVVFSGRGTLLDSGATGSPPLFYRWRLNGVDVFGATGSTYFVSNSKNAGDYTVVVSSSYGTNTSAVITSTFFGDLKFYAGITLGGNIGANYCVDFADVVGGATNTWLVLTNITLPFSPYLVIDPYSPTQAVRFYRAMPLLQGCGNLAVGERLISSINRCTVSP